MIHSAETRGRLYRYCLLLLIALIWGSQFLLNQLALQVFTAEAVSWMRAAIGFLVLSVFLRLTSAVSRVKLSDFNYWRHIILVGCFEATLPFFLVAWGQQHVDSSIAAILMSLVAIFTLILVVIFVRDEQVTSGKLVGIMLGFLGVFVLLWPQFSSSGDRGSAMGSIAILGAALSFAISLVLIRSLPKTGSSVQTARDILLCGTVELGAVLLLMRQPLIHHSLQINPLLALIAQGVFAGGIVYVLYVQLVNIAGATFAGFANYLVPVIGAFLGVIFMKERLPSSAYFAIAILSLAIFACEWTPTQLKRNHS